jgi:endogenous inhibitor of DNA gyrase (YacG/DUF329 family)
MPPGMECSVADVNEWYLKEKAISFHVKQRLLFNLKIEDTYSKTGGRQDISEIFNGKFPVLCTNCEKAVIWRECD